VSYGFREDGLGFGLAVAFEVTSMVGVGVVAALAGAGGLVVPDGEGGDIG
jgi:hypothetical protein